ncbi:centromere-associated protein E isoform X2 [Gadus macrocephalus]|uniref:centromere-associated protein E isoform X2 n=1 Tax=Gadus macrocephalus TaxID=80720 RepID=UPI0028CB1851|nr:centromere-associated protein E isoform X2 [Gadus macrocephalus]
MSVLAEESAVKVCVRVRPLIEREERATAEDSVPVPLYWKADRKSIHQLDDGVTTKSFSYDRVFSSSETTNHLYQDIAKPLVVSAVEGYNGTIFAYGQTSSGKTFTMMGSKLVPGVIPLSMEEVFQTIQNYPQKEFLLRVSYMEIYNETVTDLLVDSWKRKPLEVREALNKNIYVADLTEELVTCPAQALSWVFKGEKNRHYGKTKMNERSSRSHTIFRMILESREKSDPASGDNSEGAIIVSHLNLVDLAGSERASQTGAEGARFKEGCNINRSLFTLAQVIKKLSDESQRGFTNYRDSKLTRILQNSLGGNAKTVIICTITMAALEETLSTLQFASTAKKMKNDPHVTEVSDDGALLKRYRNEIVDLKRRLQEVSSVTHVTATEKETLSQLLQEKDQLQKEQQDRIKNLTKLLVTGSSLMPAKKIPKRRVTWGGKLVRLSGTTECHVDQSDLSFAEHFSRKRKADSSSMELLEEDEEFDSRWEIPEEYSFTTDTGSVRAHGDSSDFVSPSGSGQKEADLERRLEEERGEREEAQANVASLEGRLEEERGEREEAQANVASLEGRLEAERGEREEVLAKLSSLEGRLEKERGEKEEVLAKLSSLEEERREKEEVLAKLSSLEEERREKEEVLAKLSSLEEERREKEEVLAKLSSLEEERSGGGEVLSRAASLQQQVELLAREKREAWEEVERLEQRALELEVQRSAQAQEQLEQVQMLELRLADLQEQSHTEAEPDEQMKKEFEETIRMCETLVSEKEMVFAERDYLRQEMALLLGQVSSLEQEKGSLAQELRDFKELEEFKALEDDCSDDEKRVFQNEIVSLKSNVESWERKCRDLESQLGSMSGQLAKKSSWAQELESMQGKDLLQEVSELRRSLDDAEVLGRDTRKEWAVLRSQNLSLKERDVELSSSHQQMVVEVGGLRSQLEKEKSRFKSMQTDLQKELTVAFKENTKLTALLDGKVPSHLLENVHLEGTIASLNEELVARSEAESVLREELTTSQGAESALREELKTAQEAESALREELNTAQEAESALREGLKMAQEAESALMEGLNTAQEAESALREELKTAQEAESALREELNMAQEAESALREEVSCSEQQCSLLEGQLRGLLEEKVALKEEKETLQEEKDTLQVEKETLQEEKVALKEEKETLQEEKVALKEEKETLQEEKEALKEEKETLQEEKEALKEEKDTLQEEKDTLQEEKDTLQEEKDTLQEEKEALKEEKETLQVEKETLQEEKETLQEEKETLKEEKAALMEEKETLQEEKETLQEEKKTLKAEEETLQEEKKTLKEEKQALQENISHHEPSRSLEEQIQGSVSGPEEVEGVVSAPSQESSPLQVLLVALREEKETLKEGMAALREEKDQLQMDLQENVDMMIENQDELRSALGTINKQKEQIRGLVSLPTANRNAPALDSAHMEDLQNQVKALHAELESVRSERDSQSSVGGRGEVDRLVSEVSALSLEREQLQALLEALREEKAQLREEMDDKIQMILLQQQPGIGQQPSLSDELGSLDQYRVDDLQGPLESVTEEKDRLEREVQLSMEKVKALQEELQSVRSERDSQSSVGGREEVDRLVSEVSTLSLEREQLQALLEALREEMVQLREKLEDKTRMEVEDTCSQTEVEVVLRPQEVEETSSQTEVEVVLRPQEVEETSSQTEVEVVLRPQEVEETSSQTEVVVQDYEAQLQELKQQIQSLSAELQSVRSERVSQSSVGGREEVDRLVSEVSALSLEREQLQALLEALREEKAQDKIHMDQVNLEQRADHQEKEDLLAQQIQQLEKQLTEIRMERSELQEELAHMEEEKTGLQEGLAHMEAEKTGLQEELARMEEEKTGLQEKLAYVEKEKTGLLEELAHMEEEKTGLQEELARMEEEKTGLLEALARMEEEKTGLQEKLAYVEKEKTGLQEKLAYVEKEKTGLQEELAKRVEENGAFKEEVSLNRKDKTGLQEVVARMEEEKTGLQEKLAYVEEEKTGLQEKLAYVEKEKTGLQEVLDRLEEDKTGLWEVRNRMEEEEEEKTGLREVVTRRAEEDTTRRLKESDESFQLFIGRCCTHSVAPLEQTLVDISVVKDQHLLALPKALVQLYNQILENNSQANQGLRDTMTVLKGHASVFRDVMEELVNGDLGVLEQQRLQDVLLSAPVTPDDDLHAQWERRLPALLDRRERHLQRMSSLLEGLEQSLGSVPRSMAAQLGETGHFLQGLRDACSHTPLDLRTVEDLLTAEVERSSTAAQLSTNTLQVILETQGRVCQELEALKVETTNVLEEERSKTSALLGVDSAALDPDQLQLLRDNQKLLLQLHRSQEQLTALRRELEGLEEAQRRSSERLTINKRTTQLLQTELQDACAKIHDKETAINTLRGKLRLSEEAQAQMEAPPSVLELEELRGKVLKLEVEVTSATTKHQKEVKSLSSLLNIKEESLRKLRETLRKSQKEQQESFLQGEDLYCRLTHPEGSNVQTSGSLERSKLEEEIRLLQLKVTELQSLLSSQKAEISSHQAEISKWRSRALTLKEKAKAMRPHLAAPTTPSKKRLFPDAAAAAAAAASDSAASDSALFCSSPKRFHRALDSPRRGGDSPRRVLEAPANVPDPNQTYGVDSTEFLRSTLARPKQFFDNSTLGINPGSSSAVEQKEEMWPVSPKKEEMCTSQ